MPSGPLPRNAREYAIRREYALEWFDAETDREGITAAVQQLIARDAGRLLTEALLAGTLDINEPMYLRPPEVQRNEHRHSAGVGLSLIVGTRTPEQLALDRRTQSALRAPRKEIDQ